MYELESNYRRSVIGASLLLTTVMVVCDSPPGGLSPADRGPVMDPDEPCQIDDVESLERELCGLYLVTEYDCR